MPKENSIDVSLEELGMAYRKAKVDMYYSSLPVKEKIVNYELNLVDNIKQLRDKLLKYDLEWFMSDEVLGSWTLDPKKMKINNKKDVVHSDPKKQWDLIVSQEDPITAEFRLMADHSVHFHVLSTLWILKVGHKFDKSLSENSYGSRLRRNKENELNQLILGSFPSYLYPFRKWRESGIQAMQKSLENNKKVVAITADVTSFYHNLNPDFMKNEEFQNMYGIKLSVEDKKLNNLFIDALKTWAFNTPSKKGLPVGLPASAIIGNMALIEFDQSINNEIEPLYYGRYVDDIILTFENKLEFTTKEQVWDWVILKTGTLLSKNKDGSINVDQEFLADSLTFGNEKSRVFLLEGKTGETLLSSILNQMYNQTSEWRALPNLPSDPKLITLSLLNTTEHEKEEADNLRKVSSLSFSRSKFALTLRDMEAYQRNLSPKSWETQRKAFLEAFIDHVLVLPVFFELGKYLPRIIQLATVCEDFKELAMIINRVMHIKNEVNLKCIVSIKEYDKSQKFDSEIKDVWVKNLKKYIIESIISSIKPNISNDGKSSWSEFLESENADFISCDLSRFQERQLIYFNHDVALTPFKSIGLNKKNYILSCYSASNFSNDIDIDDLIVSDVIKGVRRLVKIVNGLNPESRPVGFCFPTRAYTFNEILVLFQDTYNKINLNNVSKVLIAFRGYSIEDSKINDLLENKIVYNRENSERISIGIGNWETTDLQWKSSVSGNPDLSLIRYQRMASLLNHVMRDENKPQYFTLPELACPPNWFLFFASKLQKRGISLISGVEYLHNLKESKSVSNQVWCALSYNGFDYPYWVLYRQDKQKPAIHEGEDLFKDYEKKFLPERSWVNPPIINHGEFFFSILICSEITNIAYRSSLRGAVDALFALEWNQDTKSFNSIVESSALDIHAYIIQCNDRKYGDSRIRAPYKDSWKRDVVRIRGGKNDFYVIGEIDINTLRRFQQNKKLAEQSFKPVPDGFGMSDDRKDT